MPHGMRNVTHRNLNGLSEKSILKIIFTIVRRQYRNGCGIPNVCICDDVIRRMGGRCSMRAIMTGGGMTREGFGGHQSVSAVLCVVRCGVLVNY